MSHAPPPGAPPRQPQRQDSLDDAIPDEAPPAYDAIGLDPTVQQGPSRMDFSGPPPLPERHQQIQNHNQAIQPTPSGGLPIPGVGIGYGPHSPGAQTQTQGAWSQPPLTPQHTQQTQPSQPQDLTPTTTPTPGRPLLHNNRLLVYPRNHRCSKCQNTGYKNYDPRQPCSSDWRKWGKPYTGALAHSYSSGSGANGTTAAENFQQPLPLHTPQQQQHRPAMGHYPGLHVQQQQQQYQPRIMTGYGYGRPPGAVVFKPGDPRIGGM